MPLRSSYCIWRSCERLCCISLCSCKGQRLPQILPVCHLYQVELQDLRVTETAQHTSVISFSSENFMNAARERDRYAAARPVRRPAPLANPGSSFGPASSS